MLLRAAKVVAVSEHTKNDLVNIYGIDPEKIAIIYPGLNRLEPGRTLEEIRLRHFLPENFILFLGTVERRKNVLGLIRAFELVAAKIPDYYLVLAGAAGPGFGQIFSAAKESRVAERILFLDYVPEDERRALYSAAKLFVYPSFYEGFGMPPLEAMSEGTPVVTSLASSLGEVVGDAALLANPHHADEIAEAIFEGITNERLRKSLILRGQNQIKKFDWAKSAAELNNVFQKIK
jgi:glycosyltransferase involved in cell wall biosynthesis